VLKLAPKFKLVIAVYPVPSNIAYILVAAEVFIPRRFNDVIALYPHSWNIYSRFVAFAVLKLVPKSKLVIALYPVFQNIEYIFVVFAVFSKFKFVSAVVAVQIDAAPIFENI